MYTLGPSECAPSAPTCHRARCHRMTAKCSSTRINCRGPFSFPVSQIDPVHTVCLDVVSYEPRRPPRYLSPQGKGLTSRGRSTNMTGSFCRVPWHRGRLLHHQVPRLLSFYRVTTYHVPPSREPVHHPPPRPNSTDDKHLFGQRENLLR